MDTFHKGQQASYHSVQKVPIPWTWTEGKLRIDQTCVLLIQLYLVNSKLDAHKYWLYMPIGFFACSIHAFTNKYGSLLEKSFLLAEMDCSMSPNQGKWLSPASTYKLVYYESFREHRLRIGQRIWLEKHLIAWFVFTPWWWLLLSQSSSLMMMMFLYSSTALTFICYWPTMQWQHASRLL